MFVLDTHAGMSGMVMPVIAGLATGSAFIILFATIYSGSLLPSTNTNPIMEEYEFVNLTIMRLKDSYTLHEPLGFTLDVSGFDSTCDFGPDITIADSSGTVVWAYQPVSLMGCGDPDVPTPHAIHAGWNVMQIGSPLTLNQTGPYTLRAAYFGKTVEQRFTVLGDDVDNDNRTQLASASAISPGKPPSYSCPAVLVRSFVKVIDSTGFHVYNNTPSSLSSSSSTTGFVDYVISPGRNGTITFTITRGGPPTIIGDNNTDLGFHIPEKQTYTNNLVFMHQENITVEQNVTSWTVVGQFGNKTNFTFYQACHDLPSDAGGGGGTECITEPFKQPPPKVITTSVLLFDHPGINVTFEPKGDEEEVLGFNESVTMTAKFSIDSDAPQGTYWMQLPPGRCDGSPTFLFTIGNGPYSFVNDDSLIN